MTDVNTLDVKDALSVASPLIKALVDTFITPKLKSFKSKFLIEDDSLYPTEDNFQEYFHRTFKKLIVVNTLVFHNSQRLLTDIYLPLTLKLNNKDKIIIEKIMGFPDKLSDEYGNILITDTAGMGKSTLMKYIFIDCINKNKGIPLFIELRRLNNSKKIIDEIHEQLSSIDNNFNTELLLKLLAEGGFVIILDGYDEIPLGDREVVTKDLQEFISKASENRFFITSRPEKALISFGNFQEFTIKPLSKEEAFELLRKYDNKGQISSLLIKKLQEKDMENVKEFLINPLLVSLLFTAFEHKQAIPFKKYLFYRQVYDANFESHDLTKGDSYTHDKYSKLEIDDFHRVLRHIGFNCFKKQRIEFTKDELLKLISESKGFCASLSFNESDFLHDIIKTVPLFTQDGNYYRWSHKSLQEYFAAQFIYLDSKESQRDILLRLYNHQNLEKYINVLDLYYDMDYKTFRNVVEYTLLKDYFNYVDTSYTKVNQGISDRSIIMRKEQSFLTESFLFRIDKKDNLGSKKINEMLSNYNIDCDNSCLKSFCGKLISFDNKLNICCLHIESSKNAILNLLFNKKNSIVKVDRIFRQENIKLDCDFKDKFKLRKITDSLEDDCNSPQNFDNISKIISITRLNSIAINHNIAKDKFIEISQSIKLEKTNNFLLDGI